MLLPPLTQTETWSPACDVAAHITCDVTVARAANISAAGLLAQTYDLDETISRLHAFTKRSADGVFAPVLNTIADLTRV